jgi:Fur family transcriptional regulator, ferric uptake regulator
VMAELPREELHDLVEGRLRASGQRYTQRRRRLVEILARSRKPVAIPEILRRKGLAQSSVYRNLSELERAGVVRRLVTDEEFGRYELAEDLTEHHHHVICSSCGTVHDLPLPADFERRLEQTLSRLSRSAGFAEVGHRLDLIGLCSDCAERTWREPQARP